MTNLEAFLLPPAMEEEKEVVVSKRFKDADGKPIPFRIRMIDQETNERLQRRALEKKIQNGLVVKDLDSDKYVKLLVQACVVYPDFSAAELCAHYKTMDPLEVPSRMLTVGEYNRLTKEIQKLNGLDEDIEEIREAVKN